MATGEQPHNVDLVRALAEHDPAATRRVEFLRAPRAVQEVGEIERSDHAHAAVGAARDQLSRPPVWRIEAVAVAHDQLHTRGADCVDHRRAFDERQRHRLFDEDVLAVPGRRDDVLGVKLMRCGDVNRVHVRVRAELMDGGIGRSTEVPRELDAGLGTRVRGGDDSRARWPASVGNIVMKARPSPATPRRSLRSIVGLLLRRNRSVGRMLRS